MKLSIPRSELKEAAQGLAKSVSAHTTLPILAGVRFDSNGVVTSEATDLDQTARYQFSNATAESHGQFVIPLQAVKDLLTKGSGQDVIEFESLAEHRVNITNRIGSQSVCQVIAGLDPEDWPASQVDVKTKPADGFLETYRKAVPFASVDSTRLVLNSVHIDVAGTGDRPVTMVATDGRRLGSWNSMVLPIKLPTIIPVTKFLTWPGLTGEVAVGILTDGKKKDERVTHFGLTTGPWSYVTRVIDGTFPNWRQVLPNLDGNVNRVTLTDEDIITLRKILPGLAGKNRRDPAIMLSPGANSTVIVTEQGQDDETSIRLELSGGSRFEGKTPVAVNSGYFCDALEAGFKAFVYQDDLSPVRSDDGQGGIHVLMPVRIGNEHRSVAKETEPVTHDAETEVTAQPITTKEADMPETKTGTTETETTALDKVLAAYEVAKLKVREANQALAEIADAVKAAVKEQRQQKTEVDNVRAALGKLQAIRV